MKCFATAIVLAVAVAAVQAQQTVAADAESAPKSSVRPTMAILDLAAHNPMPDDDIEEVTLRVYEALGATGNYDIMSRSALERAMSGTAAAASSPCEKLACAMEVGRHVGVDKVVVGDVTKQPIIYTLTLKIIDVATGKYQKVHTEEVAGNMHDVASVGVLCAVQSLHEEEKVREWKKGDWRKIRKHGIGGMLNIVMTSEAEPYPDELFGYYTAIPALPVLGGQIHYDAVFQTKHGAEIHYTPNVDLWVRQGADGGSMSRVTELGLNLADFRFFFSGTYETDWVFYIGMGPAAALNFYYDQHAHLRHPPVENVRTKVRFTANALAGMEHAFERSGWIMTIGFRAKFWSPSAFQLSLGLTRPFGNHKQQDEDAEDSEEQ